MDRYRPGRGLRLSETAPCLYPGCPEIVTKRPLAGSRRAYFCSDSCRANYYNIAQKLARTESALLHLLDEQSADREQVAQLKDALGDVRWHLARFPSIPERQLRTSSDSPTRTATEAG